MAPSRGEYISRMQFERDATMRKYLALDVWTPEMAALLACGVQPPIGCTDITDPGMRDFENRSLHPSACPFEVRGILSQWYDWREEMITEEGCANPPVALSPCDFLMWFDEWDIHTDWLELFFYLCDVPSQEFLNTLPSGLMLNEAVGPVACLTSAMPEPEPSSASLSPANPPNAAWSVPKRPERLANIATSVDRKKVQGLSTPVIAKAFAGLGGWDEEKWNKNLPQAMWTKEARTAPGRRGKGGAAEWDPVRLAKAAFEKRPISFDDFGKRFRTEQALKPWKEEWEAYEEHVVDLLSKKPPQKPRKFPFKT